MWIWAMVLAWCPGWFGCVFLLVLYFSCDIHSFPVVIVVVVVV